MTVTIKTGWFVEQETINYSECSCTPLFYFRASLAPHFLPQLDNIMMSVTAAVIRVMNNLINSSQQSTLLRTGTFIMPVSHFVIKTPGGRTKKSRHVMYFFCLVSRLYQSKNPSNLSKAVLSMFYKICSHERKIHMNGIMAWFVVLLPNDFL